jgi:hypothetical protein
MEIKARKLDQPFELSPRKYRRRVILRDDCGRGRKNGNYYKNGFLERVAQELNSMFGFSPPLEAPRCQRGREIAKRFREVIEKELTVLDRVGTYTKQFIDREQIELRMMTEEELLSDILTGGGASREEIMFRTRDIFRETQDESVRLMGRFITLLKKMSLVKETERGGFLYLAKPAV